jgi:hypothetical protein
MPGNLPPMRTSAAAAEMIDPETGGVIVKTLPSDGQFIPAMRRNLRTIRRQQGQRLPASASGSSRSSMRSRRPVDAISSPLSRPAT